jgi:hypothetical protein
MLKKTKIKIGVIGFFCVVLLGTFFYNYNSNKKVEISLSGRNEEQKTVEENIPNQTEPAREAEKTDDIPVEDISEKQVIEPKKEVVATSESKPEEEEPKITKLSITNRLVSWGFEKAQGRKIDTIIIHSSYDAIGDDPYSVSGVIAEYKSYGVSPHYLIDRKGKVYRLVSDANVAYHAGESKMPDSRTGVNNFSIGIEMLTTKKDKLTQEQYSALKLLISDLKGSYKITSVLGHNQIAPGRKDDPWNFEWNKLK